MSTAVESGQETASSTRPGSFESAAQVAIMLVIGLAAGAGSFTHVHDVAEAHGWLAVRGRRSYGRGNPDPVPSRAVRPALLGCFAAVVGWFVVGLLPWWQVRSDWADGTGSGTHVYGASAWQASTPASITVLVAAVTTVALIITTDRGWRPRTRAERSGVLAAAWLLPAVLLLWLGWTVNRDTAIGPAILTVTDVSDGDPLPPEPQVIRDHLDYQHWPGYSEGPAWGLFLGVLLVVAVSVWVTARTVRAPAS